MRPALFILMVVMNCFWAGSYSAFKALAPYLGAGEVATLRYGVSAAILLLSWPLLGGAAPRGRDLGRTCMMGIVVFVLAPRLQVAGVQLGQATDASVLMGLEPLITSVAAALFLREHIGPRRWIGFSLGLAGAVLMGQVWRPDFRWPGLTANALFVASFVCEAAYSVMGKPLLGRARLVKIITVALLAGTAVNVLIDGPKTLHAASLLPLQAWAIMAYLVVVCTLVGYVVWFIVIRETEVNVVVLTVFIQPVVGLAIATVTLKESLHWGQLWGSAAIVLGLVIGLSRQIRRTPADAGRSPAPEGQSRA
jgi:drug/metabolite transporter (DMT)-like permease